MARFTLMVDHIVAMVAGREVEYSVEIDGAVCTVWDDMGTHSGPTDSMAAQFPGLFDQMVKSGWLRAV